MSSNFNRDFLTRFENAISLSRKFLDDQCVSPELHRCENGGTCVPHQDDYNCTCVPGYTGANCETEIDECWESPCVHGNCTDSVNDYTCSCESGSV